MPHAFDSKSVMAPSDGNLIEADSLGVDMRELHIYCFTMKMQNMISMMHFYIKKRLMEINFLDSMRQKMIP